jgi:hypothetical protein
MFKPMIERLDEERERRDAFGGAVFPPGIGMPGISPATEQSSIRINASTAVPTEESVAGMLITRLMNAKPTTEALQEEKANLIAEAGELGARIDEFLANVSAERFVAVTKQHREIRTQGKRQMLLLNSVEGQFNLAHLLWVSAKETKLAAIEHVKQAIHSREHLSRWTSDREIEAADSKIVNAKTTAQESIEQEAEALRERNRREQQVDAENSKLNTLASEEIRLRAEMQRRPHFDPELGLASAPSGVISQ